MLNMFNCGYGIILVIDKVDLLKLDEMINNEKLGKKFNFNYLEMGELLYIYIYIYI